MSNYAAALVTRAAVDATRYAQQEQPALLQAAMKRCRTFSTDHQRADEVDSLARCIVAAILPPKFRMGYGPTYAAAAPEGREVLTLSTTAAREATRRAAVAVAKDYRDACTLDALTAEDPNALERIEDHGGARLTLSRYAPDPQTPYGTTDADRLAAALVAVQPEHRAALAAALDAWTGDARSITAAVAMAEGWTNANKERRTYANHLRRALEDLAPLAAPILTNPHGRTTEQTDARTPSRPAARRRTRTTTALEARPAAALDAWQALAQQQATADAAAQVDAYAWRLSTLPNDPARTGRPTDHGRAAAVALAASQPAPATPALDPRPVAVAATGRAGRGIERARQEARHAARLARQAGQPTRPERWTPEATDDRRRAWTPQPRTADTTVRDLIQALRLTRRAAAQVSRPGALASGTYQPGATDPTTASHVIVRTADAVEVRDATDAHLIATRPLEDYPALLAATRQPAALAPRHRDALTPGLPDQARAERNAAQPAPGPVAKPSGRKRATVGSTGPTVPAWR
jgi:hypothetical protein